MVSVFVVHALDSGVDARLVWRYEKQRSDQMTLEE